MKKTPWFPFTTKPVHVGVYEVDWCDADRTPFYSYWDGSTFNGGWLDTATAARMACFGKSASGHPVRWRGAIKVKKETP